MTPLEAAHRYANRGWVVIPVHSITDRGFCSCGATSDYSSNPKHAMGKHPYHGQLGHREGTSNHTQIDTWWMQWPHANVSIVTGARSKLIVLDIDKKNGGLESLERLEKQHGKLPDTPTVHSGGGGKHFYFSHPGYEVRGRRGMLPGIDVQADGGRIVAPPSNHKLRTLYSWDEKFHDETPIAKIPTWLLHLILLKQSTRKRAA